MFSKIQHISEQFDIELKSAMSQIMDMAAAVEAQLMQALQAMNQRDEALAKQVILQDRHVNQMEVKIHEFCISVIARRQPNASDLRLLVVFMKASTELEHIADAARKISKLAMLAFSEQCAQLFVSLESLAKRAIELLIETLEAFKRMDLDQARQLYKRDQDINFAHDAIVRQIMTYMMEDPTSIPNQLKALSCARALERIGDRCQNICELIVYFVKGEDVRYYDDKALSAVFMEDDLP